MTVILSFILYFLQKFNPLLYNGSFGHTCGITLMIACFGKSVIHEELQIYMCVIRLN